MSTKNQPIGDVECIAKFCSERAQVFRYKERGTSEVSVRNRRFAGKLYAVCAKHGRIGGDPSDTATQDYILENATIWPPSEKAPAPAAQQSPEKPAPAPATQDAKPAPAKPAPKARPHTPTPLAEATRAARGWGFFP